MTIVADTGPLIALPKVDQLALLPALFENVAIPPTVLQEVLAKQSPESRRIRQAVVTYNRGPFGNDATTYHSGDNWP